MKSPEKETIDRLRKDFPVGCRVELLRMDDSQAPPIGTLGSVVGVDSVATIHVDWDTGCGLGIVFGVDECRRVD